MGLDRKTILALVISFLFMMAYPFVLRQFYPEYGKTPKPVVQNENLSVTQPDTISAKSAPASADFSKENYSESDDVLFDSRSLLMTWNKKDGSARSIAFSKYINSETKKPIEIFSKREKNGSFASLRLNETDRSFSPQNFTLSQNLNSIDSTNREGGFEIKKSFEAVKNYQGTLSLSITNISGEQKEFSYELFAGPSFTPRSAIDTQYIEANFFSMDQDKKNLKHIKAPKAGKWTDSASSLKWLAVKDRHFSLILKPEKSTFSGRVYGFKDHQFSAALVSEKIILPPGASINHVFTVYAGPTLIESLEPLGLSDIVNFGMMDGIGKVLVGTLEMLYRLFKNYGVAVIVLTLLINVVLFPFTRQSYMSMKRMQLVQPQINKIREQCKNNPEKLHRETMELYKKHKVNPFGGCLPMLLQMPIFIALYVAISKYVELVNAEFLWINDLSSPDKIHLPFALPFLGNAIHLLPILMMLGMIFQQKIAQVKIEGQDPQIEAQQKMMAIMMPLIFVFIFYTMPSGLVLYWITNTVFMTLYQWRIKNMTLA